ncbi:MAG: S49 family peptidase [Magnetococcales bacterium]|nr:S49 family peptidase [Magnetococcales bacterium]MBF0151538.1 S49 family peptidase [Magnetococcales bacterium]
MNFLPHLAGRVLGVPLLVERAKLETILTVIGPRVGIDTAGITTDVPLSVDRQGLTVTPNGIAIVPIHGTLAKRVGAVEAASGLTSYAAVEEMIMDAATDPAVKAILMDIDSPGGEVGGVFDLAAMIREVRQGKPVWALAADAFSAAYLLASAAERIYLPQTAGVGSVGVIAVHVDESQLDIQEGRRYTTVFAGVHKNDFSRHEPLSDDARNRLQAETDRLYGMFVQMVAANRGLTEEAVRATEAGIYFGADALAVGLADRVGTLRDVLTELSAAITPRHSINTQKEFRMETPQPVAEAVTHDHDAIRAEGRKQFQQEAQGIVDLCNELGMPQLAGGFIAKGYSLEQSRTEMDLRIGITELCSMADMPQLAESFIAKGMGFKQVRNELLSRKARAGNVEIHSQLMPGDGTRVQPTAKLDTNPVVTACRKLATQHTTMGGA